MFTVDSDTTKQWIGGVFIEEVDFVKRASQVDFVGDGVGKDFVQVGYSVFYEYRDYSKWD